MPPPIVRSPWIRHCCVRVVFDRRVPVELPDLKGREEILKVHAKNIRISDNVDFASIARAASVQAVQN